jgi:rare lipoprotein A
LTPERAEAGLKLRLAGLLAACLRIPRTSRSGCLGARQNDRASFSSPAKRFETTAVLVVAALMALATPSPVQAHTPSQGSTTRQPTTAPNEIKQARLDHSGHKRVGMASYYGRKFSGRQMADGTSMKPESDNAASRTLPLGTTAKVTNLRDGKTAMVTIRDRGPYAKGRIIDVSPRTAQQLGIIEAGVTQVEVTPLTIPQPDGTVKSVVARSEPEETDALRGATRWTLMACAIRRAAC